MGLIQNWGPSAEACAASDLLCEECEVNVKEIQRQTRSLGQSWLAKLQK